ncbi:MAG: hypothetical protein C4293_13210 [Nitrospiraceae bacterium]
MPMLGLILRQAIRLDFLCPAELRRHHFELTIPIDPGAHHFQCGPERGTHIVDTVYFLGGETRIASIKSVTHGAGGSLPFSHADFDDQLGRSRVVLIFVDPDLRMGGS